MNLQLNPEKRGETVTTNLQRGQTYEHGDTQMIPPLDDRIADLAQSLCNEHRRILDQFCKLPERSPKLMALEAALRERRSNHE